MSYMQFFTVTPLTATAGSPPESSEVESLVKGNDDAEYYVEDMLSLLRTGRSATAARGADGWTLVSTGGVGDDEDGWITNCEWIEETYPGIHKLLGVRITFTDGPYDRKAGSVE